MYDFGDEQNVNSLVEEEKVAYNIRHRCFYFSKEIIGFALTIKPDKLLNSLLDQLIRSATSIGANMVEGRAGSSRKDFTNYLTIALKSANETKYWLCLIRDTIAVDSQRISGLINEANEISKIIASIIIHTKSN